MLSHMEAFATAAAGDSTPKRGAGGRARAVKEATPEARSSALSWPEESEEGARSIPPRSTWRQGARKPPPLPYKRTHAIVWSLAKVPLPGRLRGPRQGIEVA